LGKLLFFCGLPRSGKSTEAKNWLNHLSDFSEESRSFTLRPVGEQGKIVGKPRVVLCPDSIRVALGHRYNYWTEPFVFATTQIMGRSLLSSYDVLIDDTHTTITSIKRVLEISPFASPILVKTTAEVCKVRAIATGQHDLIPVIERMDHNLKEIEKIGFDNLLEQLRLEIDYNSSTGKVI
jgi:hypothetical protein